MTTVDLYIVNTILHTLFPYDHCGQSVDLYTDIVNTILHTLVPHRTSQR